MLPLPRHVQRTQVFQDVLAHSGVLNIERAVSIVFSQTPSRSVDAAAQSTTADDPVVIVKLRCRVLIPLSLR